MRREKCNIQLFRPNEKGFRSACAMALSTTSLIARTALSQRVQPVLAATIFLFERLSKGRNDIYNILWAVVFGFATLNILTLAARRFEPNRRGLTFGELMAVLVVLLSIFLLGWELLGLVRIFPIKLHR